MKAGDLMNVDIDQVTRDGKGVVELGDKLILVEGVNNQDLRIGIRVTDVLESVILAEKEEGMPLPEKPVAAGTDDPYEMDED